MVLLVATRVVAATPALAVAYHGDLITHPGVIGRAAVPLAAGQRGSVEAELQAGVVWHPSLMTSLQARTGLGARLLGPRGGTWGAFAHVGASRGFWTSPTFTVDDDGEVRRTPLAGDEWLTFAFGPELGHQVRGPLEAWYVRPQLGLRFPTFHGVGIDAGLELGVRFGGEG
ncbi:MAG: hypothetical protein H6738_23385 [Alphaproteobacteria bacterium]|nr:hypothetical protein [Alphaproteobacteria bacterium]MCB9699749.1 hypothetical protein [Alphaproteobacteria bacterium]